MVRAIQSIQKFTFYDAVRFPLRSWPIWTDFVKYASDWQYFAIDGHVT